MQLPANKSKIAIIILAAGASRRMGAPKQLLPWGDTTLLGHCIQQAQNTEATEIFVVLGANHEKIRKNIGNTNSTIIKNKLWENGLGGSIACGINFVNSQPTLFNGFLIMLADQPQVDTFFLNKLISRFQPEKKQIVATKYKNGSGVPAVFDKTYANQLMLLNTDNGAKRIIKENYSQVTLISPPVNLIDIDTQNTYNQIVCGSLW